MFKKIALASALAMAVSQASLAQDKTDFVVVVQDYESLPPYSAYRDGDYTGFNRELLDLFAETQGYTFTYVAYPVKRLFFEFVNGVGDLKYPDNPQWALQVKKDAPIRYSDPVVEYVNGVMVTPEAQAAGLDSVKRLGLVAGWTPLGFQERIEAGEVELLENNSYDGLLKQAIAGRIDGAYSNVASSTYYLTHVIGDPDALVFDDTLPHVRQSRVLASINHPELIDEFNAFLIEQAEAVQTLKEKHAVEQGID